MLKSLVVRWAIVALAVVAAVYIVPGIDVTGTQGFLTVVGMALVLGILNTLVKPIITLFSLPLIALTFGLFLLVINAVVFALASWLLPNFSVDGFLAALGGSVIVSIVGWLLSYVLPEEKK